ncbi:site-2 protease family protein [Actinacidiphila guanduensis]|uniref:Zn-dependent protease (Includes SpoIVFB) n=1 Tax=Actinacidiphila guanduensis TaxID=310781 RepID=A0A1H0D9L7_9ACTN|nr:site-2 protease family protein [Actinacidiphila guanduensis]SDN66904.1 Zn-dependent protease (includes SpoIVFB) [Actinacidiphila guanduensis]
MSVTQLRASRRSHNRRISPVFLGIVAVMLVSGWAVWTRYASDSGFAIFLFVVSGWLFSLCLHEYAHARTALHSGDLSIEDKGYLTLNPLKYTNAVLSVLLPVLFVIMGGIGLPGGAVYVERGRIRGRIRHSLISAAGPLTNVVFALALMLPFTLGAADSWPVEFSDAFAFLALLQVTAAIVNFLPVPGLDGYGVVEPWLSYGLRRQVEPFAPFGLLAVFGILYIQSVNDRFFRMMYTIMGWFHVPDNAAYFGYQLFRFWKN